MHSLSASSARRPKFLLTLVTLLSLVIVLLVALPSLFPSTFPFLNGIRVDTDPENMLSHSEPVRVSHNQMKERFRLSDIIVVGVIDQSNSNGVFNRQALTNVYELANFAKTIHWTDPDGKEQGVVEIDVMAPSTVDNIQPAELGSVRFEWLMPEPPASEEAALAVRDKAQRIPFLNGTIVSERGNALALYIPITRKDVSYQVSQKLSEKIATFKGTEEYHITGLPIAQDTFGVEMFVQMAVSAPLAMLLIFVLMWVFFRKPVLIISPLLVAMVSVIMSMGLLIISGQTIHIMSSMIPIFVMPIAVLDAVHILSEFFDRYQKTRNRDQTLDEVMHELSAPMLYTSLTTCAGFISLALTPIPPVQVFGIFVSIGVFFAWILTVTMIPAYISLLPERMLENFGLQHSDDSEGEHHAGVLGWILQKTGAISYNYAKLILIAVIGLGVVAGYGISKITINDNPVKWFNSKHRIRVADKVLNERFAGTYMAYLAISADDSPQQIKAEIEQVISEIEVHANQSAAMQALLREAKKLTQPLPAYEFLVKLRGFAESNSEGASDSEWEDWNEVLDQLDKMILDHEIFKRPDVLNYLAGLQAYLLETGLVGKSNSLADIVKTVHRELFLGEQQHFTIPDTQAAVGQTLIAFQNSHRPQDLWHFVTNDYRSTNLWIQLTSGDNRDMSAVVEAVNKYFEEHPAPLGLHHQWFGLTYINVVWQEKMVSGMLEAFLGSFVIVLVLMTFLFRSLLWGILAMVPLTVTIAAIYGLIGIVGKDYDMPVAVLSSLSLGLAVDYAIHFLARSRTLRPNFQNYKETNQAMFGEPARAITRNVIVIGVGFMPLLAAPLVPYQTVGALISAILLLAGGATLIILPAALRLLEKWAFKKVSI